MILININKMGLILTFIQYTCRSIGSSQGSQGGHGGLQGSQGGRGRFREMFFKKTEKIVQERMHAHVGLCIYYRDYMGL